MECTLLRCESGGFLGGGPAERGIEFKRPTKDKSDTDKAAVNNMDSFEKSLVNQVEGEVGEESEEEDE